MFKIGIYSRSTYKVFISTRIFQTTNLHENIFPQTIAILQRSNCDNLTMYSTREEIFLVTQSSNMTESNKKMFVEKLLTLFVTFQHSRPQKINFSQNNYVYHVNIIPVIYHIFLKNFTLFCSQRFFRVILRFM